jgi:hypothetical protein
MWRDIFTFRKKSLSYKSSRRDFYEGRNFLGQQGRINTIIQSTNLSLLDIEKPIKFYGLVFGTQYKAAIKHLGKPNYISNEKLVITDIKTIFYRITISGVKCILQLHFYEKQFFLGVIEMTNSFINQENGISKLVRDKYGITDSNWEGLIQDIDKNTIELNTGLVQRIIYTSGNPEVRSRIKTQIDTLEAKKRKYTLVRNKLILDMI